LARIEPPHFQIAILAPTSVAVSGLVPAASVNGDRVMFPVTPEISRAVTVITPAALVEIDATYLEEALPLSPQPQAS
jgi:hypothetical protein